MHPNLQDYKQVQTIARTVLEEIKSFIGADKTEKDIARECAALLKKHGITKTWYYACPALVLLGSRSCLSISGKVDEPSDENVGSENLVTIDLSPLSNKIWGDCSRSFVVEGGKVKPEGEIKNQEFVEGLKVERELHSLFINCARPGKTFEEVFLQMNQAIKARGYENLDFNGNVGHTIETEKDKRLYFESGNKETLKENALFTFEPHIRKIGKNYGFKLENIYYFDEDGSTREL